MERVAWPFDNPNHLGALAGSLATGLLCIGFLPGRKAVKSAAFASSFALLVLVLLSGSRGALVGTGAGSAALLLMGGSSLRRIPVWALCTVALALLACLAVSPMWERSLSTFGTGAHSTGIRVSLWQAACQMIYLQPGGVGTGNFKEWYASWYQPGDFDGTYPLAINDYLHVGSENGIAILFLILAAIAFCVLLGAGLSRRSENHYVRCLGLSSALAVLAFAVCCIFSNLLIFPRVSGWLLVPTAAVLLCLAAEGGYGAWRGALAKALLIAATLCAVPYAYGYGLTRQAKAIPLGIAATAGAWVRDGEKGEIRVLRGDGDEIDYTGWSRDVFRPLALAGWSARFHSAMDGPLDTGSKPVFWIISGHNGEGALRGAIETERVRGIILSGDGLRSPAIPSIAPVAVVRGSLLGRPGVEPDGTRSTREEITYGGGRFWPEHFPRFSARLIAWLDALP